jgi:hypothetical protein
MNGTTIGAAGVNSTVMRRCSSASPPVLKTMLCSPSAELTRNRAASPDLVRWTVQAKGPAKKPARRARPPHPGRRMIAQSESAPA